MFLLLLKYVSTLIRPTDYSKDYGVLGTTDDNAVINPKRDLDKLISLLSGASPPSTKSTKSGSMGRPNVIFAMADDLGWGDVEYNNGNARTPNLNEMTQSSHAILLQRHYSDGSVCSPTRGTVLQLLSLRGGVPFFLM